MIEDCVPRPRNLPQEATNDYKYDLWAFPYFNITEGCLCCLSTIFSNAEYLEILF